MNFIRITIIFILVLCQLLLGCAVTGSSDKKPDPVVLYKTACQIFDSNFKFIRAISSDTYCMLLPDGGWISSNDKTILHRFDAEGGVVWEKQGFYHHQISELDENYFLALTTETKIVNNKKILFQKVEKIGLRDGKVNSAYSVYDELYKTKALVGTSLDREPVKNPILNAKLDVPYEHNHFNSVMRQDNKIFVNDINMTTLIFDLNLKFLGFFEYPPSFLKAKSKVIHDFQSLGDNHFLFFKNFYRPDLQKKKTFKIFELQNNEVVFQFPQKESDYQLSDYAGGVQKIGADYLVGFPVGDRDEKSFVGLISGEGHWLTRAMLPLRIQDIKKVRYSDYLKLNKVK